jgi:hypothetical protein
VEGGADVYKADWPGDNQHATSNKQLRAEIMLFHPKLSVSVQNKMDKHR